MMQADEFDWLDAMHLASASLPIGGFAYSQGLEQACYLGVVHDLQSAEQWISDYLLLVLARQEMPWWLHIYEGARQRDWTLVCEGTEYLHALRETAELRLESRQMAHAMVRLYDKWLEADNLLGDAKPHGLPVPVMQALQTDYTASHAALCGLRQLPLTPAMLAWLWSWLDSQVLAAVKLVPLGQRGGQALLHSLKPTLLKTVEIARQTSVANAGSAPIGLMLASAQHETQYARLFRS